MGEKLTIKDQKKIVQEQFEKLKHLKLVQEDSDSMCWTGIIPSLTKHPVELTKLYLCSYSANVPISFIGKFKTLQELVISFKSEEAFLVTLATQLAAIIAHASATGALTDLLHNHKDKGKSHDHVYSGVPGAPGIGMGTGVVVYVPYDLDSVPDREPEDIESEIELLDVAFASVREDLRLLSERLFPTLPSEERALFEVYQRILDSADLGKEVADNMT